jgi:flagella basal body P-ring formation protein FlgA
MMMSRLIASLGTLVLLSAHPAGAQQLQHAAARRVAVATRSIARGAVLTDADFTLRDSTMFAGTDTNHVESGWVTRRVIAAGEVLRAPAVEPPNVVTANQQVAVEWNDQNVRLTMRGIAARNASLGSRVSVRMESGRRVETTVIGAGRVRID